MSRTARLVIEILGEHLAPAPGVAAVARVRQLGFLAHDAIASGTFDDIAPVLRGALREVPDEARKDVAMPVEVWDLLTAFVPSTASGRRAAGWPSDDFMGVFWYQVALGPDLADQRIVASGPQSTARKPLDTRPLRRHPAKPATAARRRA